MTTKQEKETLLIKDKELFKAEINERIELGKVMLLKKLYSSKDVIDFKKGFRSWDNYNSEFLKVSFNVNSNEYKKEYDNAGAMIGFENIHKSEPNSEEEYITICSRIEAKTNALELLANKVNLLKMKSKSQPINPVQLEIDNKKVFIVHGHNGEMENKAARTLSKLGLDPIILHEQASQGKTIIEKIEKHSDVGFAVVLLTGDDLGEVKGEVGEIKDLNLRARQNVIFELGYFMAKLGRGRVVSLYEAGVELPNDLSGVVYVPIDEAGAWAYKLTKELKAAEYEVSADNL